MIYHKKPKSKINCLYCNKKCSQFTKRISYNQCRWVEYLCNNHYPLNIKFFDIKVKANKWHYGWVDIELDKLKFGFWLSLNEHTSNLYEIRNEIWACVEKFDPNFIISNPTEELLRYLNLYRVFS